MILPGQRTSLNYGNLINRSMAARLGIVSAYFNLPLRRGGAKWFDAYSTNHGALTNGPTWSGLARPGGWGSLAFAGSASREQIDCGDVLFFPNDFTVSFWVYKRASSVAYSNLWGAGRWNTGASAGTNEYTILLADGATGNNDTPELAIEVGVTTYTATSSTALTLNTWTMLTGTRIGGTITLYMNSSQVAQNTGASATAITNRSRNFKVADSDIAVALNSNALFDGVLATNRGLASAEVTALYDESRAGYPTLFNRIGRPLVGPAAAAGSLPHHLNLLGCGV